MAEDKAKKPTAYEIFLRNEAAAAANNWTHVTTIEAASAAAAMRHLMDMADTTNTDASGDYMVVPKSNVTYLRPQRKVTTAYDMEPFDVLAKPPVELAEAPAPVEDDAA